MQNNIVFIKNNKNDLIWWVSNPERIGEWLFSFDKKRFTICFRTTPTNLQNQK